MSGPKRVTVLAAAVVGTLAVTAAGLMSPASARGAPHTLQFEKVVVGTPPPDATFRVVISCNNGFELEQVFDGPGESEVLVTIPNTCTVSESETGGASSVSFACEDDPGLGSECQSDTTLTITTPGTSRFIVTNTFDPAPPATPEIPATPVPGTPRFTG